MQKRLYDDADLYQAVFPLDDEEVDFWRTVTRRRPPGPVIDIGAGPSPLAVLIGSSQPVAGGMALALDWCQPMLKPRVDNTAVARPAPVRADARALPVAAGSAAVLMSRLFGVAYAVAHNPAADLPRMAAEVRRVLKPGGIVAFDIPISHHPAVLEWEEETAELGTGFHYTFHYNELIGHHDFGKVLETEIVVERDGETCTSEAHLFVFRVGGALEWAISAGLTDILFMSCYDTTTLTTHPPADLKRAVMTGRRDATWPTFL